MRMQLVAILLGFLAVEAPADVKRVLPKLDPNASVLMISGVTLNPPTVTGGAAVSGTVTLARTAGGQGVVVTFRSSNAALAAVPSSVVVQAGSTKGTFVVQTYPVSRNPNVVADPPAANMSEGVAGPATCNNSHKLESSNTLYAQVPPSVAVSPGASMTMFPITTSAVPTPQTLTIKVFESTGSSYRTATMTITP